MRVIVAVRKIKVYVNERKERIRQKRLGKRFC